MCVEPMFLHELNHNSNKIVNFLVHNSDGSLSMLTVLVSLDRLYAIQRPMNIKNFFTNLHAKYSISLSLGILLSLKLASLVFCEI